MGGKSISIPDLEVIHQLRLSIIDGLLVESSLVLVFFKLVKCFSVLALEVLHFLKLNQLLLVNDVFSGLLFSLEEVIVLGGTWRHCLSKVGVLLLLGHVVEHVLNLIDF